LFQWKTSSKSYKVVWKLRPRAHDNGGGHEMPIAGVRRGKCGKRQAPDVLGSESTIFGGFFFFIISSLYFCQFVKDECK
jgi:hypothetical protein